MAQGKCTNCGHALTPGWHGDHIKPFSYGGATDVINGQALCPTCNLKKGVHMGELQPWPETIKLRDWQEEAYQAFLQFTEPNFLAVATPGAGKTIFGARVSHSILWRNVAQRIVVVCPTEALRKQWADVFSKFGIELDANFSNDRGRESSDYQGVVITYQQVSSNSDIHRMNCRIPTFVILDEIHHAGDGNSWGDALRYAFDPAVKRLLLSGTPFRTDNNPIPYVVYKENFSKPNYSYGYGKALADAVCRPILFPSFEGEMQWYSGGDILTATFRDTLAEDKARERLRTALSSDGDWINTVLKEADAKLTQIRANGHPDAGGLIIAMHQYHARDLAALIERISGEKPTLVISDEIDSTNLIKAFARSDKRWIVAVRMVSEGVDIPRLRVGVFASDVQTPMFFRQVVGRFVRWIDGLEEQSSYLYIPRDETHIAFAQAIKEERDHQLLEEVEEIKRQAERKVNGTDSSAPPKLYAAISSTGQADDVIYDNNLFSQSELEQARKIAFEVKFPSNIPTEMLAKVIRLVRADEPQPKQTFTPTEQPHQQKQEPLYDRKKKARMLIRRLVAQVVTLLKQQNPEKDTTSLYPTVYYKLTEVDGAKQDDCTLEQLEKRVEVLSNWLKERKVAIG